MFSDTSDQVSVDVHWEVRWVVMSWRTSGSLRDIFSPFVNIIMILLCQMAEECFVSRCSHLLFTNVLSSFMMGIKSNLEKGWSS